ncbi:MAG: hypothetical protein HYX51_03470 [Chloroflexi bacterium]|nr:hypothetical protein [Chloroflexota bacterium]
MRVLITDFTRMTEGFICVAGIDVETHKRVRPVIGDRLQASLAATRGGVFDMRRLIDLGPAFAVGRAPEVEDYFFTQGKCAHVQTLNGAAFFDQLRTVACSGLVAFGPELDPAGKGGMALAEGAGRCSLVITRSIEPFDVVITERGSLRARWAGGLDLSVTDIRLYHPDFQTPDRSKVAWLRRLLASDPEVYLCYGVSRAFKRTDDDRPRHWLQLNNIHLSTAPDWQLRWPAERYGG